MSSFYISQKKNPFHCPCQKSTSKIDAIKIVISATDVGHVFIFNMDECFKWRSMEK